MSRNTNRARAAKLLQFHNRLGSDLSSERNSQRRDSEQTERPHCDAIHKANSVVAIINPIKTRLIQSRVANTTGSSGIFPR